MIAACAVEIYSTEGNLKSTIRVLDGHKVVQLAFHHGIYEIIVLTYVSEQDSWFFLGYSEKGVLENLVFFRKKDPDQYLADINMQSHPSGQVAVLWKESIMFI